jgi:hypothetical protein
MELGLTGVEATLKGCERLNNSVGDVVHPLHASKEIIRLNEPK